MKSLAKSLNMFACLKWFCRICHLQVLQIPWPSFLHLAAVKNVLGGEEFADSVCHEDKLSHLQREEKKGFIKRGINIYECESMVKEEEVEHICRVLRVGNDIEARWKVWHSSSH